MRFVSKLAFSGTNSYSLIHFVCLEFWMKHATGPMLFKNGLCTPVKNLNIE